METTNTPDFQEFARKLLKRAKIKDSIIDEIWSNDKYKSMIEKAFIHKSYDNNAKSNYEKVETLGDLVLNMAIVNYVVNKYGVLSSHWLSNIKHRLISSQSFARLAQQINMYPYIKMGWEDRVSMQEKMDEHVQLGRDVLDVKDYRSLLEDVFEAFCGTLQVIINDRAGMVAGPGYAVCYEFIKSFLDNMEIPMTVEEVFDPISRVKEIYDMNGWSNKSDQMTKTRKLENGDFQVTYIAYFNPNSKKFTWLGSAESRNKKEARREAAVETLKILEEKYGITKSIKGPNAT